MQKWMSGIPGRVFAIPLVDGRRASRGAGQHHRQLDGPGNREAARLIARIGGRDVGDSRLGPDCSYSNAEPSCLRRKKSQFSVRRQTLRLLTTPKPRPRYCYRILLRRQKKCANRSTCSAEAAR